MPAITASAEVNRPAEEVYAYATDPTRFNEWQQGVVSGHMEPADANGKAHCVTVRKIGLAERASNSVLVNADPPRTWSVHGIDGPIRARVHVTVTSLEAQRSHVTIAVDFEGHGIGKLLVPLVVRRQAEKEMPTNLLALKRQMEQPT